MAAQRVGTLITGATGLVGASLAAALETQRKPVIKVSRRPPTSTSDIRWDLMQALPVAKLDDRDIAAVVHLAGDPVFGLWSAEKKKRIHDSRVIGTKNLCEYLAQRTQKPRVVICASAVGYYGDRGDALLNESSAPGKGFLAKTCVEWEAAARPAMEAGIRVVHLRIGIVLSAKGGALKTMLTPFRFGLGGKLGSGEQWMSWITLDDLLETIQYTLEHDDLRGPVNAVAPHPVTNAEFTRSLGSVLGRPAGVPVPGFALRMLPGNMAQEVLLASARVVPAILQQRNFGFQYPTLEHALQHVLS